MGTDNWTRMPLIDVWRALITKYTISEFSALVLVMTTKLESGPQFAMCQGERTSEWYDVYVRSKQHECSRHAGHRIKNVYKWRMVTLWQCKHRRSLLFKRHNSESKDFFASFMFSVDTKTIFSLVVVRTCGNIVYSREAVYRTIEIAAFVCRNTCLSHSPGLLRMLCSTSRALLFVLTSGSRKRCLLYRVFRSITCF